MLLVAGRFVSDACAPDFSSESHLQPFLSGVQSVPVMTYFCHPVLEPALVCDNLVCVGAAGLLALAGLRVGFLSAAAAAPETALQQARGEGGGGGGGEGGIDLLVCSSTWPRGVMDRLPAAEVPHDTLRQIAQQQDQAAAAAVARAVVALAPRYVFAPSPDQFVERRPFSLEGHRHVCRFLALAKVGNPNKQKWLFAFKLRSGEVVAAPEGTTLNPLLQEDAKPPSQPPQGTVERRRPREDEEGGFQRWGAIPDQQQHDGGNKRRNKGPKLQRNIDRGSECWFCLDSSNAEQHLVASVGSETYLAVAKGAIVEGHILVLPLEHVPSLVRASVSVWQEMERYMRALRAAAKSRGELMLFYERNVEHAYEGPHCHIQAMPLSGTGKRNTAAAVAEQLQSWTTWTVGPDGSLPADRMRRELQGSYFWIELDGKMWVSTAPKIDLDFGRKVFAEAAGVPPARIHWKRCVVPVEEEKKQVEAFTKSFRQFDNVLTQ